MGRKNANPPSQQEADFQIAFEEWERSNYTDKKSWDKMFYRVHEACYAIAAKMCIGVYNPMFEERVMDATIYFMNRIKTEHLRPSKLSSWCYLGVKGYIYGIKQQREDKEISLETLYSLGYEPSFLIEYGEE